jgi:ATP-binding cassette subfamily C (CFTR/MRP) protein 4
VGIVGRTGAGKSSIIQALFRIVEPEVGSQYTIGGSDALQMGLHSLRQHISVIPQTPFLFRGSIRKNVDPFDSASEQRVWEVLHEAGL